MSETPAATDLKSYISLYLTVYHKELIKANKRILELEEDLKNSEKQCHHSLDYHECYTCEKGYGCDYYYCENCEVYCEICKLSLCIMCSRSNEICALCGENIYQCCMEYRGRNSKSYTCKDCGNNYHAECKIICSCTYGYEYENVYCGNCCNSCKICDTSVCGQCVREHCDIYYCENCIYELKSCGVCDDFLCDKCCDMKNIHVHYACINKQKELLNN